MIVDSRETFHTKPSHTGMDFTDCIDCIDCIDCMDCIATIPSSTYLYNLTAYFVQTFRVIKCRSRESRQPTKENER